ncbi:hypothetical protein DACRYDRAFT_118968 [Dacryopinax primogenitus]|uniref:Uncharacterized protein n=1 Tax=Dacryopinax primogenitus (strain DJM 731) TaxID=1858805 RepID=M5FXM9_DACPD|nr:uncharacterized protein DACRYDRAFT_118968 [Dacryopinax primogenitus]EJT98261.1 hypothetical protein DACRYDRAFT_118968 [Dacryopinax primogenitus]
MAPSPSERLLASLIKADTTATNSLSAFLASSHASHAALSAYASVHQPPLGDVLRQVEASLRGVHEAVRAYVGAMEMWTTELGEVKEREEEVGQVRRDRDILVTRLIKASKLRPVSAHGLLPSLLPSSPHSSVLSLPAPGDTPKLVNAQAELQACEGHLVGRQRALEDITKAAIARGILRRCAALEELAEACKTASGRARGALHTLVPAKFQNGTGTPFDKPLPSPSPYVHRQPPRAASPSSDSLSPSQSASQIAHYTAPHLPHAFGTPEPPRQSTDTYRPSSSTDGHRLSLTVPPAHAISATYIPDSRLLPPPEARRTATPQPTQHARPPSRQQVQQEEDSDSEEHGAVVVHENAPRNSMSFPTGTPSQQHAHSHLLQHSQPHTPIRKRTVSSATPSKRKSKRIALPSASSDLGPGGPPVVQMSGSPLTGSLPRPRPQPMGHRRRPSSQSLDSFELPTRQQGKRRGFFGSIARALHIGGSSRDGRESPPYGASGSGWGKQKDRGWNTRTDRRLRDMHDWRGESSDEDGAAGFVAVENSPGLRTLERSGTESTHVSGGARKTRSARAPALNGTPTRSTSRRRAPEQPPMLSPHEALEKRLDAAARPRTVSHPGPSLPGARQSMVEPITRMRTISEASGTGNRRSLHEASVGAADTAGAGGSVSRQASLGRASGQQAAQALGRSGRMKSVMSNATSPPGAGPTGGLSRSGTVKSTMSAPPGPAQSTPGKKSSPAKRQQHRASNIPGGSPNILTVLDGNESGTGGGGKGGLVEVKAPPRVLRDPAEGLITVKAPPPAGAGLPPLIHPPPGPQLVSQSTPQAAPRANGTANLARNVSTSTSASATQTRTQRTAASNKPHPTPQKAPASPAPTAPSHSSALPTGEQVRVHHTPVPSATAPMPVKSALRARSPSPEPPRPIILAPPVSAVTVVAVAVPTPSGSAASAPAPPPDAPVAPPRVPTPAATTAALLTTAQPRPQPPEGAKQRPVSAATFGTSGDDASAYETGLEEMEDSGSESHYSGTPGISTPKIGLQALEEELSTPVARHTAPASVPAPSPSPVAIPRAPTSCATDAVPVAAPAIPQPANVQPEAGSGVSDSTATASDKPTRRKSVRLDVPPSLTPTPATEDFPEDTWKVSMEDLANAVPSRSYLNASPIPAAPRKVPERSPQRNSHLWDGLPLPQKKGLGINSLDAEDRNGWHTRVSTVSSGDSSDEEDEEYARVKRELEDANRRYAQAGKVGRT